MKSSIGDEHKMADHKLKNISKTHVICSGGARIKNTIEQQGGNPKIKE